MAAEAAPELFPADKAGQNAPPRRYSLIRLSTEIARRLGPIGSIEVDGEAHRPKAYTGATFFTLKDRSASLTVTVPSRIARKCRIVGGERVRVTGALVWQAPTGQVHLQAIDVAPVGEGAVAAAIEAARARLRADGVLDRPRRPLPLLPRRIGVLCGTEAAVLHDIRSVVATRFPGYPLRVQTCTVGGAGAAVSIEEALSELLADDDVEVVILARGGGDPTQLLPFSDEQLCRAVALARVPIVAAIGHEDDRPLVDEVADHRYGTPSLAAAAVVPDQAALVAGLDGLLAQSDAWCRRRLELAGQAVARVHPKQALGDGVSLAGRRLERAGRLVARAHPAAALAQSRHRLARADYAAPTTRRFDRATARLTAVQQRFADLGPQSVLARGYAVVRDDGGSVVRRAGTLAAGNRVTVELEQGRFTAIVEGVEE